MGAERTCIALPDELSYVDGALISCGFGTAHQGLLRIQVNGADDLLVVGLGPVGLAAAMVARGLGVRHVYGVEVSPLRQKGAMGLGFFDADEVQDVVALLKYLADPWSDLRAAAFLRSRFVRLSDAAIARLAVASLPASAEGAISTSVRLTALIATASWS